jgi:hypothetical protein
MEKIMVILGMRFCRDFSADSREHKEWGVFQGRSALAPGEKRRKIDFRPA